MNQSDNPNERRKEVVLADGKTYVEVSTLRHYWLFDRYEKKDCTVSGALAAASAPDTVASAPQLTRML
jgi:hypothetical protein